MEAGSGETGNRDAPASEHVVVWCARPIELAHVLERPGRTPPEHRRRASGQVTDFVRADVLLCAAVPKVSVQAHPISGVQARNKGI